LLPGRELEYITDCITTGWISSAGKIGVMIVLSSRWQAWRVLANESAEWQTKQLQLRILGYGNKHSFSSGKADRLSESN
jgi:hypothetical protein